MRFKEGVKLGAQLTPQLVLGLAVADQCYREAGAELTVTSLADGVHSQNSLHYVGRAADLRTKTLTPEQRTSVLIKLKRLVLLGFDVLDEGDHFHIEFDPKGG